jgi:hypothetical protein
MGGQRGAECDCVPLARCTAGPDDVSMSAEPSEVEPSAWRELSGRVGIHRIAVNDTPYCDATFPASGQLFNVGRGGRF